jgi:type VI secretion system protein ImpC
MPKPSPFASMKLDINAGTDRSPAKPASEAPFRILLLGDFSGRANRGAPAPPSREPVVIDRDNFDQVLANMGAELHLGGGQHGPRMALRFQELEDFHPDQIYEKIELFQTLRETRHKLGNPSTFAEAAAAVKGWAEMPATPPLAMPPPRPERSAVPPDPAALAGGSLLESVLDVTESRLSPAERRPEELQAFIEQAVAPHVVPRQDPQLSELVAQVDAATGKLMCAILHHKDFQALEAAWRGVFFLVRGLETGTHLKLYLLDISKAELAADLNSSADLRDSEMHRLLGEEAVKALGAQPWAMAAGNFTFSRTEADIETLGRLAELMRVAGAPFLAEVDPAGDADSSETARHWRSLRHSPAASWLGLALPRFLLRLPYGRETAPVESFAFEEMPGTPDHQKYLWGNPAFACVYLLGQAFSSDGWNLRPGVHEEIGGLPLHLYEMGGEKRLKPCAELLMTDSDVEWILEQGLMPLVSLKNEDAVRLRRFQSIAEPLAPLSGRWN